VLLDGPAGSSKSFTVGHHLVQLALKWPGCRLLVFRKTRVSLTQSWMVTFEEKVLPYYPGLDYLTRGASRATRGEYVFRNGSRIVLGGMDNPTRLFSTEYDVGYGNEINELTLSEWESLHRAMRNGVMPYQQLIGDCNPDAEFHWANQRCTEIAGVPNPEGKTLRLQSFLKDNPAYWDGQDWTDAGSKYLFGNLGKLTGLRRRRLVEGLWISAEGQIWDNWDPKQHIVKAELIQLDSGGWTLRWKDKQKFAQLEWFFGAMDWGFRHPGTFHVYGVDSDDRIYLIAQWHHTQRKLPWWASNVAMAHKRYGLSTVVGDPSRPDTVALLNDMLMERQCPRLVTEADNRKDKDMPGLDLVRDALDLDETGYPAISFLENSLQHPPDPEQVENNRPTCVEREIPSYVWKPASTTDPEMTVEEPLKKHDDGCDTVRYACAFKWGRDYRPFPKEDPDTYKPGTWGHLLKLKRTKYGASPQN